MIVAHEASRTGAPIVAQNLAEALSAHYNVVIYSQRGGDLLEAYRDACVEVRLPRRFVPRPVRSAWALSAIAGARRYRFAILNSAETHPSSQPLAKAGVPFIALIHEFAAYLGKRDRIQLLFRRARALVFSSTLTREDSVRRIGVPEATDIFVLPQGKCVVPGAVDRSDANAALALTRALRPPGSEGAFLVLGAGSIDFRKGVDLFVSLAVSARAAAPEIPWRFVWVGGNLDGTASGDFRLYIADQIDRSGVGDIVAVLPATAEIETAYEAADVMVLTSRLDPLPNVAIDALTVGLPVLSFDKATGLAELQRSAGLDGACLAPYLDLPVLTDRLTALARSPDLRKSVGEASALLALERFQMESYAAALMKIAETAYAASERAD